MPNELLIGLIMGGVFGTLFVAGYFMNGARAKRWSDRVQSAGMIHCGVCQKVGTLAARTTSTGYASSSNLVLACSSCGSHDWKVV